VVPNLGYTCLRELHKKSKRIGEIQVLNNFEQCFVLTSPPPREFKIFCHNGCDTWVKKNKHFFCSYPDVILSQNPELLYIIVIGTQKLVKYWVAVYQNRLKKQIWNVILPKVLWRATFRVRWPIRVVWNAKEWKSRNVAGNRRPNPSQE